MPIETTTRPTASRFQLRDMVEDDFLSWQPRGQGSSAKPEPQSAAPPAGQGATQSALASIDVSDSMADLAFMARHDAFAQRMESQPAQISELSQRMEAARGVLTACLAFIFASEMEDDFVRHQVRCETVTERAQLSVAMGSMQVLTEEQTEDQVRALSLAVSLPVGPPEPSAP